jgi:RND family efflux transporter MFP subunit
MPQVETPQHVGPLGSGGHGYDEHMTDPSSPQPVAHAATTTEKAVAVAETPGRLGGGFWVGLILFLLVIVAVIVYGIHVRSKADTTLATETKQESTPDVKVVHPSSQGTNGTLILPGSTMPYVDTPIYSRTNGYLQKWFFDIGARVKKGQLMAVIETPELDQQLQVAQADLKSAQANLNLANITSTRYQNLLKSNSVSKQETDQAMGDAEAKEAAVEASMANVRRLQQLQSFENVYAPFDGVVTARNTDIGDLITGGSANASTAKQLFHLAAIGTLRVYVSVPEIYSSAVRTGGTAELTLDEFPGETFNGVIARNSSAIDPASRTLNVEVDVPNGAGKLLPGAYAMVHFKVPAGPSNLTIPSNTLIFRAQGMQVAVVRNGKIQLTPVKISQDHGSTVDVASGLTTADAIVIDPSDSITNGQPVNVIATPAAAPAGATK